MINLEVCLLNISNIYYRFVFKKLSSNCLTYRYIFITYKIRYLIFRKIKLFFVISCDLHGERFVFDSIFDEFKCYLFSKSITIIARTMRYEVQCSEKSFEFHAESFPTLYNHKYNFDILLLQLNNVSNYRSSSLACEIYFYFSIKYLDK